MRIEFRHKKYVAYNDDGYVIIISHNKNIVLNYIKFLYK